VHAPDSKITVTEALELWIRHSTDEGLERATVEQRVQHLRHHIAPFIGRIKLSELSTPRLYGFLDQLRDDGRSPAMRRKILASLNSALTLAKGRGLVAQNVATGVKIRSSDRHRGGPVKAGKDFPTKQELKLLIDRAPDQWRAFIITSIFTGMRASELRGLTWSNVNLDSGTIHVSQRADKWGTIGSPKSWAGKRDIPLVPLAVNTLRQWKLSNGQHDLVFPTKSGSPRLPMSIFINWRRLLSTCGLPNYKFHSLRHACASMFIELGWQPKRIQDVLGHSSITMTFDRYGHLFPQADLAADMAKLEAAIVAV
jgi:integrase